MNNFRSLNNGGKYKSKLSMLTKDENGLITFNSLLPINVVLPTRDRDTACVFLSNTCSIVESTWDSAKLVKLNDEQYVFKFPTLPIPGFEPITPEIEVRFEYSPEGVIKMKSSNWNLGGDNNGKMKDSRFMSIFQIELEGSLCILPQADPTASVSAEGYVKYTVRGEKPSLLNAAPDFLIDRTIEVIKDSVGLFAGKSFSDKLLKAFRTYALEDLKAKAAAKKLSQQTL